MNRDLQTLLHRRRGVLTRADVRTAGALHPVDYALRAGQLQRAHPGIYTVVDADHRTRRRAALAYCRGRAALSHTTALDAWQLHHDTGPIHVTTSPEARIGNHGLIVHRRIGFALDGSHIRYRDGLPATLLEQTLVDSWPLLPPNQRREPVIHAITDRRTTATRIQQAIPLRLADKATLTNLLHLLAIGCHSPLEIWGHLTIFTTPGMPNFQHQVPIRLPGHTIYLDLYAPAEKLNIELDGDTTHTHPTDRERDLRRDAALATLGILVVRYTHHRLTHDPDGVRREVLAILRARRSSRQ